MKYLVLFAQRINLLRIAHCLTFTDLALMLNQNSSAVVKRWASEKNWASCETLIAISRLFGVSLDWLMGSSDEIYQDAFVLERERTLIKSKAGKAVWGEEEGIPRRRSTCKGVQLRKRMHTIGTERSQHG